MSVTPPPFQVQQAPPRSGSGNKACIWVAVGLVACCLVLIVMGFVFFKSTMGAVSPMVGCAATMEAASDALQAYADDHGGKYPPAETWMDEIQPYYEKLAEDFNDAPDFVQGMAPAEAGSEWACDWPNGVVTGVAYNTDVAGKTRAEIKDPAKTPLVYELPSAARNQHAPYTSPPKKNPPAVFGNPRDWAINYVDGDNDFGMDTASGSVKFGTGGRKIEIGKDEQGSKASPETGGSSPEGSE
ncbi:MAG: hypothetical protein AB7F50_00540 [Fimbriimonadaceae bacterium]